ncbi:MAG: class I SAM-dependent methyltransferase [Gallionellaceae bacterium]|nr:class I SAM-dependent methyltransferase [Gallionellaceae bacterium]
MTNTKPKAHSTPHRSSQGGRDFRKRTQRHQSQATTPRETTKAEVGSASAQPAIFLHEGREKSLLRHHPWIFSGAVARIDGAPSNGDTVPIKDAQGNFVAWAAYNAASQITARVWSWQESEAIDADFFQRRISAALTTRFQLGLNQDSNGMRLIHAESDGLPGLVVDQYMDVLVMQISSAGVEHWRDTIANILQALCHPVCIYERSDSDSRTLEGLEIRNGILRGALPPATVVNEHGLRFAVDVAAGQKTGFYLDQRDNRELTGNMAEGKSVLNCFCYTGGFSLYALRGGATSVLSIDASQEALELAQSNITLNGLDASRAEWLCDDVFLALRKLRDQNKKFDLIILDPPKFAPTAAFAEKAARGYKDINLLGFKLLNPGGLLFTYSCSGGINDELFQKIIAGAALDAGVDAQIVRKLHATPDHPVLLSFPEGAYLKGLLLKLKN